MKIAFLIQFNQPDYGGVFYSSTTRIKSFIQENEDFEVCVFNLRAKPGALIRLMRYMKTRKRFYTPVSTFHDLTVTNIYYRLSLTEYIKSKLCKNFEINYKKKVKGLSNNFIDIDLIAAFFGKGSGELALHLSEFLNKKFTVTFHGSDIHTIPFQNEKNFLLYKKMLNESSANIFVSKGLMDKSLKILNTTHKNYCFYDSFDFRLFKKIENKELNDLKERLGLMNKSVVGFVGSLIDVKNVFSLVDIFYTINKKSKSVCFLIIGVGNLKKQLEKSFINKGVDVHFLGNIPNKEMPLYYNLLDVLVLPSKQEGLPRVIIEALACGVNCAGSNVGGIPELLPKENIFELGDNFERLAANRIFELIESNETPVLDKDRFDAKKNAIMQGQFYRNIIDSSSQ